MSTDENRGKAAVKRLEVRYDEKKEFPAAGVVIRASVAADILDYVHELESRLGEAEYEYGVENTMINSPYRKNILDNKWFDDLDKAEYHKLRYERMTFHSLTNLRIVKRRKAGPVEGA